MRELEHVAAAIGEAYLAVMLAVATLAGLAVRMKRGLARRGRRS